MNEGAFLKAQLERLKDRTDKLLRMVTAAEG
jgi:hypothetical protein